MSLCQTTTYWPPTDHQPTTNRPPTDRQPTNHLPTTYRPLTDHFFTEQLVHNYHQTEHYQSSKQLEGITSGWNCVQFYIIQKLVCVMCSAQHCDLVILLNCTIAYFDAHFIVCLLQPCDVCELPPPICSAPSPKANKQTTTTILANRSE